MGLFLACYWYPESVLVKFKKACNWTEKLNTVSFNVDTDDQLGQELDVSLNAAASDLTYDNQ